MEKSQDSYTEPVGSSLFALNELKYLEELYTNILQKNSDDIIKITDSNLKNTCRIKEGY